MSARTAARLILVSIAGLLVGLACTQSMTVASGGFTFDEGDRVLIGVVVAEAAAVAVTVVGGFALFLMLCATAFGKES